MRARAFALFSGLLIACSSSDDTTPADAAVDAAQDDASDPPLTCEARVTRSTDAVNDALEAASLACTRASDCESISIDTACHASCGALVASADRAAIEAAIAAQDRTTCAGFETDGCERLIPPCVPPGPFDCVEQRCTWTEGAPSDAGETMDASDAADAAEPPDASDAGEECLSTSIELASDGGFVFSRIAYALEPCAAFHAEERDNDGTLLESCDTAIVAGDVSVADLNALIARPDVQAAIAAAPVLYGVDTRPVDGTLRLLVLGDAHIDVGNPCSGQGSCTDIPEGIEALLSALGDLAEQQNAADPSCPFP